MSMRVIKYLLPAIAALLSLSSCDDKPSKGKFSIAIDSHTVCTFDAQSVDISYTLSSSNDTASAPAITATTDAEWLDISRTSRGSIVVDVEQNEGELRTATITLSGEGIAPCTVEFSQIAAPAELSNHTLIYYFFGTSLSRYFDYNIEDASTAIGEGILGNNNRVVLFRQTSQSSGYYAELCYDPIHHNAIVRRIKDITLPATTTSSDIATVIDFAANIAPAKRYGMVLAGHGQGWVTCAALNKEQEVIPFSLDHGIWTPRPGAEVTRAFGERNVQVDIATLAEGITAADATMEYLLFDACFMSNIEALYDLRNAAHYIIASPCEIMGRGFPYHRTLPYLFANDGTSSDLEGAAESYYIYYRDEYTGASRCGSVAVIDCTELEPLADATRTLLTTATSEYDASLLQTYEGHSDHIFYDFGELCSVVATDSAALDAFKHQMELTVVAKYTLPTFYSAYGYDTYPINEEAYSGVTTSEPSIVYTDEWRETSWYSRIWE